MYPKSLSSDLREINLTSPRYIKSDKVLDFYDDNFHKDLEKIGISSVILPDKKVKKLEGDIFIPGEYEITNITKEEGYVNAYISALNQTNIDTTLRYYPGWILKKTDMYSNEITQRGSFISFNMDPGSVDVKLIYTPVSLYLGARLSAILFIVFSWLYYFLKRNMLKDVKF